ncbi:MAG TPA: hypothetical protein VFV81_04475 [Verrucomicrobiae bacterium]|nr:hypothetical protein [Verrucomicrobiae bacterium]
MSLSNKIGGIRDGVLRGGRDARFTWATSACRAGFSIGICAAAVDFVSAIDSAVLTMGVGCSTDLTFASGVALGFALAFSTTRRSSSAAGLASTGVGAAASGFISVVSLTGPTFAFGTRFTLTANGTGGGAGGAVSITGSVGLATGFPATAFFLAARLILAGGVAAGGADSRGDCGFTIGFASATVSVFEPLFALAAGLISGVFAFSDVFISTAGRAVSSGFAAALRVFLAAVFPVVSASVFNDFARAFGESESARLESGLAAVIFFGFFMQLSLRRGGHASARAE